MANTPSQINRIKRKINRLERSIKKAYDNEDVVRADRLKRFVGTMHEDLDQLKEL